MPGACSIDNQHGSPGRRLPAHANHAGCSLYSRRPDGPDGLIVQNNQHQQQADQFVPTDLASWKRIVELKQLSLD